MVYYMGGLMFIDIVGGRIVRGIVGVVEGIRVSCLVLSGKLSGCEGLGDWFRVVVKVKV